MLSLNLVSQLPPQRAEGATPFQETPNEKKNVIVNRIAGLQYRIYRYCILVSVYQLLLTKISPVNAEKTAAASPGSSLFLLFLSLYFVYLPFLPSVYFVKVDVRFTQQVMDESSGAPDGGDPPDKSAHDLPDSLIDIASDGDVVLDVLFENSKESLRAAKKAAATTRPRPGQSNGSTVVLKTRNRVGYRVQLATLKRHSKYFSNLLGDTRFEEARSVADALKRLSLQNVRPSDADLAQLPLVRIVEDDEATRSVGRENAFGDLLRILHAKPVVTKPVTMNYVATLAVLADRFDCTSPVSRYVSTSLRFKWPVTQPRISREDDQLPSLSKAGEDAVRQKIMVSWLLDQPLKMHSATRELIMYGSSQWTAFHDGSDLNEISSNGAMWWDLQDGLESKLVVSPPF